MKVAAIVLAAGASTRMGQPKQLLPYGSSTILGTVLDALLASPVDSVSVVLGHHAGSIRKAVGDRPVRVVLNPEPQLGMLSSVQCGLLPEDADAYLIALGDQPQIQPRVVQALLASAESSSRTIFLPTYAGERGHPLLIRASHRPAILELPHTVGLNAHITACERDVEEVEVSAPGVLEDVDTPDDYARSLVASTEKRCA